MSAEILGKSIADATNFLHAIHDDMRSQIRSLDRLMFDRGWRPVDQNKVGWTLGNSLSEGRQWVIDSLQRCYVRTVEGDSVTTALALFWYLTFDAEDAHQVPTVAAVAARFGTPKSPSSILSPNWHIGAVYRAAERSSAPVPLADAVVHSLMPMAESAAALILPLCELTSESELAERLVEPMLAAERELLPVATTPQPSS